MSTAPLILSLGSHEFPLSGSELKIGRDPQNEVVLSDDSVSAFHSVFAPSPHGVVLKDLDTANGTFVNGRRIKETFIELGDQIRFGNVEGKIDAPKQSSSKDGFCPDCGAGVAAGSKFCSGCGKPIENQPKEAVEKDGAKPAFSWWPQSQIGGSVAVFIVISVIPTIWLRSLAGALILILTVFGLVTLLRYAYFRLIGYKKRTFIPAALWKRWPIRTAIVMLAFTTWASIMSDEGLNQRRSQSQNDLRQLKVIAAQNPDIDVNLIQDDSVKIFRGMNITARGALNMLELRVRGVNELRDANQMTFYVCSLSLLFMFGYVLYDGLDEHRRAKSKT